MNTIDMNAKRVGSFAPLPYQLHHLEQANSPPFIHHNGLGNRIGFGAPGSPIGMPGMSPAPPSTSSFSSPPPPGHMGAPSPQTSTSGKSDPPKRLRYWLIDMIESGQIPGLRWEDENKTIFRIPWKHAGKNNWKEDDCKIFKVRALSNFENHWVPYPNMQNANSLFAILRYSVVGYAYRIVWYRALAM